jgi:RNA 2',3'-cyclic 3'-phosphodiesterase
MSALAAERSERLFIGVPVPEKTRLSLMRQIPSPLPGKPTRAENWHFTLRFLGSTEPAMRDRLIETLRGTRFGNAFDIEFDTMGAFPNPRRARVVWVGVGNGHEALERIAEKAESAARAAGFDAEARKFTAHLTISRMKQPESAAALLAKSGRINATMQVTEVVLYRSELGGQHSRYAVVAAFPLR